MPGSGREHVGGFRGLREWGMSRKRDVTASPVVVVLLGASWERPSTDDVLGGSVAGNVYMNMENLCTYCTLPTEREGRR